MLILLTIFRVVLRPPYWKNPQAGASLGSLIGTVMHYIVIINWGGRRGLRVELLIAFFLLQMKHVAKV